MNEARSLLSRDTHVDEPTLRRLLAEEVERADKLAAALRKLRDAQQNMGDFWAYGMSKAEGAEPTDEDTAAIMALSTASRIAVYEATTLLETLWKRSC